MVMVLFTLLLTYYTVRGFFVCFLRKRENTLYLGLCVTFSFCISQINVTFHILIVISGFFFFFFLVKSLWFLSLGKITL